LFEFHETEVLSAGEKIKITDTNFYNKKYKGELYQTEIPE
jgi:hypothetical protein